MELEQFNDLEEALVYLNQQGYIRFFHCCPCGWTCKETQQTFSPEELQMETCHRFHSCGGSKRVEVLYTVVAPDGSKGIIIDNCSTYGNPLFAEYLLRMKLKYLPSEGKVRKD